MAFLLFPLAAACGGAAARGSEGPPAVAPAPAPPPAASSEPPTQTTTTAGLPSAAPSAGTKLPPAQWAGEPGRTTEDIAAGVRARRDDFRACYDRALKDHPSIEGELHVKFVIDAKGAVTEATVDRERSTIREPAVDRCIVGVLKGLTFAPSAKGLETHAHYPFNFNPRSAGKAPPTEGKKP